MLTCLALGLALARSLLLCMCLLLCVFLFVCPIIACREAEAGYGAKRKRSKRLKTKMTGD